MNQRTSPNAGAIADVRVGFDRLEAWHKFVESNGWAYDPAYIARLVDTVRANGLASAYFGYSAPSDVQIDGTNYRETIVARGCSARVRAMLEEVLVASRGDGHARILMLEAITPFALAVRGRFPYAIGSEYLPTDRDKAKMFPIPHCDITNADFPSGAFDVIVSNDVLEHVPDLEAAMRESRRLLRPGGACLATFPFASGTYETSVRAKLVNGEIEHLHPPEYHGNPVDPEGGSLVFAIPGWDILDLCRRSGFKSAQFLFVSSANSAITGSDCAGVHILKAVA